MDALRGVIDRFEGDVAVIVLDDGQQLLWPRAALPRLARPGTAVGLYLVPPPSPIAAEEAQPVEPAPSHGIAAELPATVLDNAAAGAWPLALPDGSVLRWPVGSALLAPKQPVWVRLVVDLEDTIARRKRVQSLLDELFGSPGT
ncbi:MAG: DUF3006 domain-containing protein [Anaerolineae bacterium]|nr:DUF3006 domain-containing protein [Anaerolineae bacterium]MDW8071302.1 DUF3006 domain-containing protein [Anaerolineae bacterium]